ncbi:MAG: MMPL family transporter [Spirochaetales bacterium]|nr:MMPL family transporter [Spirochaetales bacterium]
MFDKLFEYISRFIVRCNKWIIGITIILAVGSIVFMFNLKFENDFTFWIDKNSTIGKLPHYINEKFGSNSPFLIAIECDDVFTFENLDRLNNLSTALEELPEVEYLMSLATVDDVTSTGDGIRIEKLISYPLPDNRQYLDELKKTVLAKTNYTGKLVSKDGTVALVIIKSIFKAEASHVANIVKETALTVFDKNAKLYFSGSPFLLNSMAEIVIKDFVFLIPLVSLLIIGILFLSFRTIRGVLLPLLTVLFSTALTMGIMSAIQVPLNVLSSAVPVLLIAVGSAYGIHILNNYYEYSKLIKNKAEIVSRTIKDVGLPVLMAGLTTTIGFASNAISDVSIIKTFGIFTALGVTLAMIIAILFIPSILINIKIKEKPQIHIPVNKKKNIGIGAFGDFCSRIFVKHKYIVITIFCVIAAGALLFSFGMTSKVDVLGYFDKDSEPRVASDFINRHFGGFNPLNVYARGDILEPDLLKLLFMLNERIRSFKGNLNPSGITDIITELNDAMTGFPVIPETKAEVENLMFFVQGQKTIEGMLTKENNEALISVMVPSLENIYLDSLFIHINSFIDSYNNEFSIIENKAGNPALDELMFIRIKNLLKKQDISYKDSDIQNAIKRLNGFFASSASVLDTEAIMEYCTGDESEIIFSEDEADRFVRKLALAKIIDADSITSIVMPLAGSDEYTADDFNQFALSISMIIRESENRMKIDSLCTMLVQSFAGLENTVKDDLKASVSPFLWETIPVTKSQINSYPAAVIRKARVDAFELTGTAYMLEQIRKSIFINQFTSIAIALIAVFILNWMTFGSFIEGIVSLVAIVFTIIFNFGIMGIMRIPLDFVTAIIASVAIGTGIDYTIHFISRYTKELKESSRDRERSYVLTVSTTGKAIIFNAISVGAGFAVLVGSNVLPMRTAGILLAITMAISSLSAMTFLPAVLAATNVIKEWKTRKVKAWNFGNLFAKVKSLHSRIWRTRKQEI